MARRDDGAYREYGTEEQQSQQASAAATRRAGALGPVFSVARQLPIPDRRLPRALNTGQIASSDSALIYVTK
ncbi:MAG: hypothetical protein ACRD1R_00470, partial [Acidobacteriota bacterium]